MFFMFMILISIINDSKEDLFIVMDLSKYIYIFLNVGSVGIPEHNYLFLLALSKFTISIED